MPCALRRASIPPAPVVGPAHSRARDRKQNHDASHKAADAEMQPHRMHPPRPEDFAANQSSGLACDRESARQTQRYCQAPPQNWIKPWVRPNSPANRRAALRRGWIKPSWLQRGAATRKSLTRPVREHIGNKGQGITDVSAGHRAHSGSGLHLTEERCPHLVAESTRRRTARQP